MIWRKIVIPVFLLLAFLGSVVFTIVALSQGWNRNVAFFGFIMVLNTLASGLVWLAHVETEDQKQTVNNCKEAIFDLSDALDDEDDRPSPLSSSMTQLRNMMFAVAEECEDDAEKLVAKEQYDQAKVIAESGLRAVNLWLQYSQLVELELKLHLVIVSGRVLVLSIATTDPIVTDWNHAAEQAGSKLSKMREMLCRKPTVRRLAILSDDLLATLPQHIWAFDRLMWATWPRHNAAPVSDDWSHFADDLAAVRKAFAALSSAGWTLTKTPVSDLARGDTATT